MVGSSPSTTSFTRTSGTMESVFSLTPPAIAMCECVSIIPGITKSPSAAISATPSGFFKSGPISTILPAFTRIEAFGKVPDWLSVITVAFRIKTVPAVFRDTVRSESSSVRVSKNGFSGAFAVSTGFSPALAFSLAGSAFTATFFSSGFFAVAVLF